MLIRNRIFYFEDQIKFLESSERFHNGHLNILEYKEPNDVIRKGREKDG